MTDTQNGIAPEAVKRLQKHLDKGTKRGLSDDAIFVGSGLDGPWIARGEIKAMLAALQRQPAQFSQWNSAIFAAANAIKKAEPPKKPSHGNVLDRSDYYCTRADYVNAVLALAQSPLSQGGAWPFDYLRTFDPDSLVRICAPDKPNELGVGICKLLDLMLPLTQPAPSARQAHRQNWDGPVDNPHDIDDPEVVKQRKKDTVMRAQQMGAEAVAEQTYKEMEQCYSANDPRGCRVLRIKLALERFAALQHQPAQSLPANGILSCPFCASNACSIEHDPYCFAPSGYDGWRVRCERCACQTCWWHSKSESVVAWNNRPTIPPLTQSPPQGGESYVCPACGSTVPNHHYVTCQTKLSDAEAVVTLREKMVKALDGHTKYSRDCDMSGEFLTSQVWPMVEATIRSPAIPAPVQGVTVVSAAFEEIQIHIKAADDAGYSDLEWVTVPTGKLRRLREALQAALSPAAPAQEVTSDIINRAYVAYRDFLSANAGMDFLEYNAMCAALKAVMPAPAQVVTVTKDKNPTAETVETVISLARQAAFLHSQLTDSPDYPTMLFARLARLHDAMTVYDGEEPDLTFCCHCHELIEGGQFVMFGAKYHEVCAALLQAALHPARDSP